MSNSPGRLHLPRLVGAMLRAEISATAAYRAQILAGAFGWVVPLAMLAIWRTAAADRGDVSVDGVTTYYLAALVLTSFDPTAQVVFGFAEPVRTGQMSALLLRPVHPVWGLLAKGTAQVLLGLVASLAMVAAVASFLPSAVVTTAAVWVVAGVCWAVGLVGVGYAAAIVGALSFWTVRAEGMQSLLFVASWLFGGFVAPFAVVGGWWGAVAIHQPFWLVTGAPAELVSGLREVDGSVGRALVAGLVWLVVLHRVQASVWVRAVRRYEAVGT